MTRRGAAARVAAIVLVAALAMGANVSIAPARGAKEATKATEIGVTADEIRVAVVADVENPLAPGLFKGAVDAAKGWRTICLSRP